MSEPSVPEPGTIAEADGVVACTRCDGPMDYSGEHRLGGSMFTCRNCGTTVTP